MGREVQTKRKDGSRLPGSHTLGAGKENMLESLPAPGDLSSTTKTKRSGRRQSGIGGNRTLQAGARAQSIGVGRNPQKQHMQAVQ